MKLLKLSVIALALTGCSAVEQSTSVTTNLEVKEYNVEYAKYMPIPGLTFLEQMNDGNSVLAISRDHYDSTFATPLRFAKNNVQNYAAFIDKYIDWAELAVARGDVIDKEIGRAKTWKGTSTDTLKFTFHSDNSAVHYLSISACDASMCFDDKALYFDKANAYELKNLLLQAKVDDVKVESIDDIYK